jgi:signal transduction histidine kinase
VLQSSLDLKGVEFEGMIATVESLVQQLLTIKKIKLNVSIEVPKAELFIDEELLIRVLVNLIDNAIKFSYPNSEVHLRIYKEDTKLIFSVSDNGILTLTRERSYLKNLQKWANSELQMKAQRNWFVLCRYN